MRVGIYANGTFLPSQETYELFNPHSGEKLADVAWSSPEEMREVVGIAAKGYDVLKEWPAYRRAEVLYRVAELLAEHKEEMAGIISREAAKPITAARGELDRSIQTIRFAAEEAKRLAGEAIPLDAAVGGEGRFAFTIRQPIGVIGAITPFNFPLNLVVHKVGPAFAAGNSIIVKPAEQTPLTSIRLAELFTEAGAPPGAVNVVPGDGPSLGKVFLEDERIKKITFTGSPEVGKIIKSQAGLKKVTLELGSNSAMYVDESMASRLEQVVDKAVVGAFSYSGQVCISTQRIYVHEALFDRFVSLFVNKTEKDVIFGPPDDEKTVVSSLINKKSQERLLAWIEEAKQGGAKVLTGGYAIDGGLAPTVLTQVKAEMKVCCQEVFGPIVIIDSVSSADEALQLINNSRYGLNAGIFTQNIMQALHMAKNVEVGQVLINDVPTLRFDHMPYGGVKESGYGREGVKYAIQEMTDLKMISLNYTL